MPICYLLDRNVSHDTLLKVIEFHLKFANFEVLRVPEKRFDVECEAFFFSLVRSGMVSVNILNLFKNQLLQLTIDEIENLMHDVQKSRVVLNTNAEKYLLDLRKSVIKKVRKKSRVPAMFLYHKLQENQED